jgi:6-phospho-3-hexuloisomerase
MARVKLSIHPKAKKLGISEKIEAILAENSRLLKSVSDDVVEDFLQRIKGARAVFFSAQGRSGFVLRCFCMRLMHLGYQVYVCGETVTPAITPEDLLVVLSGSGETPSTLEAVVRARDRKATVYGVLGNLDSRMASLVDTRIHLPGRTKLSRDCEPHSLQMAGSLFEQCAFLFFEAVVLTLYQERLREDGSVPQLHAVIE